MLIASLVMAAVLGFSLNRAGFCSVKAVAEVVHSRTAFMLLGMAKAVLWVELVLILLMWSHPPSQAAHPTWALTGAALAGGFLFGVGAAVNGGCALSTVSRLGDGELAMVVTIAAMLAGGLATDLAFGSFIASRQRMVTAWPPSPGIAEMFVFLIGAWAIWEGARLWLSRPKGLTLVQVMVSDSYRLSSAALIIGISNGILYFVDGPWAFTSAADQALRRWIGVGAGVDGRQWALLIALLAGAILSAAQRRRFRLDWKPRRDWFRHGAGGALMGIGASMTPGGNDALMLQAAPSLSPHALPAIAAMMLGIFAVIAFRRARGRAGPRIQCGGDVCVEVPDDPTP